MPTVLLCLTIGRRKRQPFSVVSQKVKHISPLSNTHEPI